MTKFQRADTHFFFLVKTTLKSGRPLKNAALSEIQAISPSGNVASHLETIGVKMSRLQPVDIVFDNFGIFFLLEQIGTDVPVVFQLDGGAAGPDGPHVIGLAAALLRHRRPEAAVGVRGHVGVVGRHEELRQIRIQRRRIVAQMRELVHQSFHKGFGDDEIFRVTIIITAATSAGCIRF